MSALGAAPMGLRLTNQEKQNGLVAMWPMIVAPDATTSMFKRCTGFSSVARKSKVQEEWA